MAAASLTSHSSSSYSPPSPSGRKTSAADKRRPQTPRRAEVRVGRLPSSSSTSSSASTASSTSDESTASLGNRRHNLQQQNQYHHSRRRSSPDAVLPARRPPRAVPLRRLAVRQTPPAPPPLQLPPSTVQLDLTGVRGVRAEVAFCASTASFSDPVQHPPPPPQLPVATMLRVSAATSSSCGSPTFSASGSDEDIDQGARMPTTAAMFAGCCGCGCGGCVSWGCQCSRYVQVRNPLCVPRGNDYLASWRTCMVPIAHLEGFAFMKPPRQKWRHLSRPSFLDATVFSLMSYNILSDQYASSKCYWYCPDWALAWPYRRQGILEIIVGHLPSVLCLQEVETEQFYAFFQPTLAERGYEGVFAPKSRARTMEERPRRMRVDGCAVFGRRDE